jgi:DNA polymerase I
MHRLLEFEPSVATWIEWKEAEKIRSTYGKSLLDKLTPEGRIHARFKAFGTTTGRFSSSSPNLQNIPKRGDRGKQMRGLFWSGSDDRVLTKGGLRLDRAVARGRALRDPYMQDALQQGVNMHVGRRPRRCSTSSRGRSLRSKIRRRITSALPA